MELLDRIILIIDRKYLFYINGYRESKVTSKKLIVAQWRGKRYFMLISDLKITLNAYTSATEFTVVGQKPNMRYENGRPTTDIDSVSLTLFDSSRKDRFSVKIPLQELPFTEDELKAQNVQISLVNPSISIYADRRNDNRPAASVKAEGYKILKGTAKA